MMLVNCCILIQFGLVLCAHAHTLLQYSSAEIFIGRLIGFFVRVCSQCEGQIFPGNRKIA